MQADAVISFPLFKHKPMPCHVYISLSKRRPKAPKRSHSSLEVYPSLKSLAQSLRGVAAISSCVADLLHGLWHIAEGPPKRVVSSQAAAAQSSHTEKPCRATCSELSSAGTGQIVASDVSARYLGISAWPCRLSCQTGLCLICTSDCNSTVENAHVWRWFCSSLCYQPSAVLTKLADWLCWELNNNNLAKKKRKKKKSSGFRQVSWVNLQETLTGSYGGITGGGLCQHEQLLVARRTGGPGICTAGLATASGAHPQLWQY